MKIHFMQKCTVKYDLKIRILLFNIMDSLKGKWKLLENRILGARESHRIIIEVCPERAPMGRVIKDHGGIIL